MQALVVIDDYIYSENEKSFYAPYNVVVLINRYLLSFEKVRVVARCFADLDKSNHKLIDNPRIEVFPVPMFRGVVGNLRNCRKIRNILYSSLQDIDRVILRLPSSLSFHIYSMVKKKHLKYAVEVVFDPYDAFINSDRLFDKILSFLIYYKQRGICFNADGVACVSESYLQKRYYSKSSNSFQGSYSSIELSRDFYSFPRKYPDKLVFSLFHSSYQIDYDGRKGHKLIIQSIAYLLKLGLDVEVIFAGEDYSNGISKLKVLAKELGVEDKVKFVGLLCNTEIRSYLLDSDLFVFPTQAEGLPRSIIEAMAVGLPCISTNVSAIPELINKEFLLDSLDYKLLADKIYKVLSNNVVYESESSANFEKSLAYEASLLNNRRKCFYDKMINQK